MYAYSIHQIQDVHEGKKRVIAPKTVFPIDQTYYDELEPLGAVRKPTETELALYSLANQGKAQPVQQALEIPAASTGAPTPAVAPQPPVNAIPTEGLETKFRGAAKWSVVKGEDRFVDGLATKEDAEAWITKHYADSKAAAGEQSAEGLLA